MESSCVWLPASTPRPPLRKRGNESSGGVARSGRPRRSVTSRPPACTAWIGRSSAVSSSPSTRFPPQCDRDRSRAFDEPSTPLGFRHTPLIPGDVGNENNRRSCPSPHPGACGWRRWSTQPFVSASHHRSCSIANLYSAPGRWGCRLLDDLLVDAGGHSMLERDFLRLMRLAGLPRPRTQVIHRRGAKTFARVDFLFDPYGIVVEVSGRKGHSSPTERQIDAQRRNELQDVGRRVFEYTYEDVSRRPDHVIATMTRRLGRRLDCGRRPALPTPWSRRSVCRPEEGD